MKLVTAAIALSALVAGPAFASKELAQKNNCLACHAVDKKLVGPAYQEVAKKGKSVAELAKSIKAGGSGKYGPIPMPPQPQLSDADATALATWIHGGAK